MSDSDMVGSDPEQPQAPKRQREPAEREVAGKRARRGSAAAVPVCRGRPNEVLEAGPASAPAAAAGSAAAADGGAAPDGHPKQLQAEAAEAAKAADKAAADALRLKLAEAEALFREQRQHRQLWLEVDLAARLAPTSLVGRHVRVLWPDDDAWYLGTITAYHSSTGEHMVSYADGESERVVVALERVRLLVHAGERLEGPDRSTLSRHAATLRQLAGAKKWAPKAGELRTRADALEALAQQAPEQAERAQKAAPEQAEYMQALAAQAAAAQHGSQPQPQPLPPARPQQQPPLQPPAPLQQAGAGGTSPERGGGGMPPSVVRALQLAAGLPEIGELAGVRLMGQKFHVRLQAKTMQCSISCSTRTSAAVARDLYSLWKHLALHKPAELQEVAFNVPQAQYAADAVLVSQLRALHDTAGMKPWLERVVAWAEQPQQGGAGHDGTTAPPVAPQLQQAAAQQQPEDNQQAEQQQQDAGQVAAGPEQGGKQQGLAQPRPPSIVRALQLATGLPQHGKLAGSSFHKNAYVVRWRIAHQQAALACSQRSVAAVGCDLYTLWKHLVNNLPAAPEDMQLHVAEAGYADDPLLVKQLRAVKVAGQMRALMQRLLFPEEEGKCDADVAAPGQQQEQGGAAVAAAEEPAVAGTAEQAEAPQEGWQQPTQAAEGQQAQDQQPVEVADMQQQQEQQQEEQQREQQPDSEAMQVAAPHEHAAGQQQVDACAAIGEGTADAAGAPAANGALVALNAAARAAAHAAAPCQGADGAAGMAGPPASVAPGDAAVGAEAAPTSGVEAVAAAAGPADSTHVAVAGAAGPADSTPETPSGELLPGDVGWFQVKGFPHWPFLVITPEEAAARGLSASTLRPGYLPVQYFGMGDVQAVNPRAMDRPGAATARKSGAGKPCFAPFLEGLDRGYHTVGRCRRLSEFKKALFEVVEYFQTGELPLCMLPRHNDGHGVEQDEDEALSVAAAKPAAKRRKGEAKKGAEEWEQGVALGPDGLPRMPMRVNQELQVVALGSVEWLHPAFHNEKRIFPVGYRARRMAKTPASGGQAVPHTLEVLQAEDGSGPLFRVTPEGRPPVEGSTPMRAWQALYAGDAARAVGISGDQMFGFSSPKVQRAIEMLPGAARCDRYCGWPEGQEPVVPPLSFEEQRERLACESRMQKLPEGVAGVAWLPGTGICDVCGEEEEDQEDLIVKCSRCHVFVHMSCYGVQQAPHGRLWLCDVCSLGLRSPPPCALCPVLGGALKRTSCGRWAHYACARWLPETGVDHEATELHLQGIIQEVHKVHRSRFQLTCQACKQPYGACVQCCEPKCYAGFHALCARQAGYKMQMEFLSDGEESEEECEEAEGAQHAQRQQQHGDASCDENDAGMTNDKARGPSKRGAGGKRKGQRRQEGTQRGNVRLLAFCPKHGAPSKPAEGPGTHPNVLRPLPTAACCGGVDAEGGAPSRQPSVAGTPACLAGGGDAAPLPPPPLNTWGCARAVPFNYAARRGQRAPEALAAAEAKRGFVRSVPYIVGAPGRQQRGHVPPSRKRSLPLDVCSSWVALEAPEAAEGMAPAAAGAQQAPGLQQQQQPDGGTAVQAAAGQVQQHASQGAGHAPAGQLPQPVPQQQTARGGGEEQAPWGAAHPYSPPAGAGRLLVSPRRNIQSEAEQYREMVDSLGHRVTIGKSGIHGWGAFAKTFHAQHAMVIEYSGELVRVSVGELREQRLYDSLVGAGTYVFRLNAHLLVDATRKGNLAHMLNHSCSPNCYSRTISILEEGRLVDHVIILAKRDIHPGEELTYDYRFCGEEQLPCNCGVPGCKGLVNEKPPDHGVLVVPRSKLRPYLPRRKAVAVGLVAAAPAAGAAQQQQQQQQQQAARQGGDAGPAEQTSAAAPSAAAGDVKQE